MNKLLKDIDIKLFLICLFIITSLGLYVRFSIPMNSQIAETNIINENGSKALNLNPNLLEEYVDSYKERGKVILFFSQVLIAIFSVWFLLFLYSLTKTKAVTTNTDVNVDLNSYISKLEKNNKEINELKEELYQQTELLAKTKEKLENNERRYNDILKNANISIFEWNIDESTVILSEWFKEKLGFKNCIINSKEFLEFLPDESREVFINSLYEYLERKKGIFKIQEKCKFNNDTYEWFEVVAQGVLSEEGIMTKMLGSIQDITAQKLSTEKIKKLEYTDYLTGLPNKTDFLKMIRDKLNTRNEKEKIFMFLVDIDDLGIINSELGNEAGDEILKVVANRIRNAVTATNYVARLYEDEFLIVAFNLNDIDSAHKKAMKIISEFEKPFYVNDNKYYMTASMGIVVIPDDGLDEDYLIKNATEAMYRAKQVGKNTYRFYTESINQELIKKLEIINNIKLGIERDEFYLNYQPQYNISSGKIVGFEGLIRWNNKAKGYIIYPIDFLAIAEESGLIVPIGEKLLIRVCKQAEAWYDNGFKDIVVSVNISSRQFYNKNFYNVLKNIVDSHIIKNASVNFEICEDIVIQDTAYIINLINKIKDLGFTFSIHNIGNNLMSIIQIKDLPIKTIKIDKRFVAEQSKSKLGYDLMRIFIKLAHSKGFEVVAEGIENETQAEFFKDNGCNIAQGYYFSKALDDTAADELLKKEFLI